MAKGGVFSQFGILCSWLLNIKMWISPLSFCSPPLSWPPLTLHHFASCLLFSQWGLYNLLFTVSDAGTLLSGLLKDCHEKGQRSHLFFMESPLYAGKALNHTLVLLDKVTDKMVITREIKHHSKIPHRFVYFTLTFNHTQKYSLFTNIVNLSF